MYFILNFPSCYLRTRKNCIRCTHYTYALNFCRKNSLTKVLREVRGLRKLDQPQSHKNIVRYYSCWVDVAPVDERQKKAPWADMINGDAM